MALLSTVYQVSILGTSPTYGAVAASDTMAPDDSVMLHVKNAGGSADTAVVVIPGTYVGQAIPDISINVPATTGSVFIGPLAPAYADPTTGLITVTHSFTTSVTCALVRL